ncbi:hypothetical protein GCM10010924_49550 [Rhizobium wenxiniae]|nr:hypothetical protein GCM10010924_49550 [Rhizobium wenxiniae]
MTTPRCANPWRPACIAVVGEDFGSRRHRHGFPVSGREVESVLPVISLAIVELGGALVQEPRFIPFDEPFDGVNPVLIEELWTLITEL